MVWAQEDGPTALIQASARDNGVTQIIHEAQADRIPEERAVDNDGHGRRWRTDESPQGGDGIDIMAAIAQGDGCTPVACAIGGYRSY